MASGAMVAYVSRRDWGGTMFLALPPWYIPSSDLYSLLTRLDLPPHWRRVDHNGSCKRLAYTCIPLVGSRGRGARDLEIQHLFPDGKRALYFAHQNIYQFLHPPHQERPIVTDTSMDPHGLDVPGNGRCHRCPFNLLHPTPSAVDAVPSTGCEVPPSENSL